MGYFVAKVGRNRVCALLKGSLVVPSDINGVQYIRMDGNWQLSLAKELRAAGITVDTNNL